MMRKILAFGLLVLVAATAFAQGFDMDYLRKNFSEAFKNEQKCHELLEKLEKQTAKTPTQKAYYGGLQMGLAKYTTNVLDKMDFFKKGKKWVDEAISAEPNNVEIRFIRYSLQSNLPRILNYNNELEEDRKFIEAHLNEVKGENFRANIRKFLDEKGK